MMQFSSCLYFNYTYLEKKLHFFYLIIYFVIFNRKSYILLKNKKVLKQKIVAVNIILVYLPPQKFMIRSKEGFMPRSVYHLRDLTKLI